MTSPAAEDSATPPDDELIGVLVNDRYRIVRVLGEGGMGTVYEAEHELIGRRVALKTLLPQLAKDPEILARFRREARAASTIGHDHIVDVTDMGSLEDGSPYLVMEMLAGRELAQLLEETGALPVGRAVRIMSKVCSALAAAHAVGIVHRDLKPANIFLVDRQDGQDFPKVLDFGISKVRGTGVDDQGLTNTGVAIGTPAYMSPEQAQGLKTVDQRTDVYAVGVILFELLSGQTPFSAESYASLLIKVLMQPPPPLTDLRKDVPQELSEVILRSLEKKPENRFPSVEALAEAIAPFAELDAPAELTAPAQAAASQEPEKPEVMSVAGTQVLERDKAGARPTDQSTGGSYQVPRESFPVKGLVGVGAAILAVILVGAFFVHSGTDGSDDHASGAAAMDDTAQAPAHEPPPEPTPALPSGADTPASTAPPPTAPTEVRVQIRVVPTDAEIFIGDVRFPNPMDAQQPRSLTPTTLRITHRGYRTIERAVIFDRDRSFDFEMSRGHGVDRGAGARGRAAHPRPTKEPAHETPREAQPRNAGGDGIYHGDQRGLRDDF